jgi:hypothetical protein
MVRAKARSMRRNGAKAAAVGDAQRSRWSAMRKIDADVPWTGPQAWRKPAFLPPGRVRRTRCRLATVSATARP